MQTILVRERYINARWGAFANQKCPDKSQIHRETSLKREVSEKPKIIGIGSLLVILEAFEE